MDDRWLLTVKKTWIKPAPIETQPPIEIMFISEISSLSRGSPKLLSHLVEKTISVTGAKPEIRWANLLSKIESQIARRMKSRKVIFQNFMA